LKWKWCEKFQAEGRFFTRQLVVFSATIGSYFEAGEKAMTAEKLIVNRSMPNSTIIPVLVYENVREACDWLCAAFGFRVRLWIGTHRAQLLFEDSAIAVSEGKNQDSANSVMVRVADAHSHFERARQHGAKVLLPPTDHPYGERQYTVEDFGGHRWTFSQSIADVNPEDWGGVLASS
jgi:uncharacterized glyoxalase superfamily protein PhnB